MEEDVQKKSFLITKQAPAIRNDKLLLHRHPECRCERPWS